MLAFRQVTRQEKLRRLQRQMWEKELRAETNMPAKLETRERAAKLIQKYCRYFIIAYRDEGNEICILRLSQ